MPVALAMLVFTIQPRSVRAQARSQPDESEIFLDLDTTNTAKPDLKAVFDKEIATLKSGTAKTDFSPFNQAGQTSQNSGGKFGTKQKLFLGLWVVCMTAIVIVLIKHPCREKKPHDCDPIDDTYY
jgi:hypothetical protein